MEILLLGLIAFYLYKIYKQRNDEKKLEAINENKKNRKALMNNLYEIYPHLKNNIEDSWLEVFGTLYLKNKAPLLKAAWYIYVQETCLIDNVDGRLTMDTLWNLSEELLEHLEKYHEGEDREFELSIITYWQKTATHSEILRKKNKPNEINIEAFNNEIFRSIENIMSWFPEKENHPKNDLIFTDKKGVFPRSSSGSVVIQKKLEELGL